MVNFSDADIFLLIVGFFLPPLVTIGLTLLGHLPGIAYAWYIIYKNRDHPTVSYRHGRTYVAVSQQQPQQQPQPQFQQQPQPQFQQQLQQHQQQQQQPPHYQATAPVK
ncbi:hypothetical protein BGX33_011710 [Mortierella sp. NVP41]|nr:hypothetical protein BGX33_011710 [Mortierella sp. NVP41]